MPPSAPARMPDKGVPLGTHHDKHCPRRQARCQRRPRANHRAACRPLDNIFDHHHLAPVSSHSQTPLDSHHYPAVVCQALPSLPLISLLSTTSHPRPTFSFTTRQYTSMFTAYAGSNMAPLNRSFSLPVSLSDRVSRLKVFSGNAGRDEVSRESIVEAGRFTWVVWLTSR